MRTIRRGKLGPTAWAALAAAAMTLFGAGVGFSLHRARQVRADLSTGHALYVPVTVPAAPR
jgi:hypothetical protein